MQKQEGCHNSIQTAAGPRRLIARVTGATLLLCALVCFCAPAPVSAAEWRGARLTGYAPLYLPTIVQITIQASPETFGTVTGGGDGISPGEDVTVTAQPNAGYYFAGWYEDNILVSDSASYTFRADRDRHLVASFSDNPDAAGSNQNANAQDGNQNANAQDGNQNANAQDGNQNANAQGGNQNANAQGGNQNANTQGGNQNANAQGGNQNANAQGGNQNANAGASAAGGNNAAAQNTGGTATTPGTTPGTTPATTPGSGQAVPYVPANSNDMPTTGVGDMYRVPVTIVLLLFGLITVIISIPSGRRRRR